jgi:hypothetical protein
MGDTPAFHANKVLKSKILEGPVRNSELHLSGIDSKSSPEII